jgi:hypothetical protein
MLNFDKRLVRRCSAGLFGTMVFAISAAGGASERWHSPGVAPLYTCLEGISAGEAGSPKRCSAATDADDASDLSTWILLGMAALLIGGVGERWLRPESPEPDQKQVSRPSGT